MNKEMEFGYGYIELGLATDAKAEFMKVPASDPDYAQARAKLMLLADHLDAAEQSREADAGLKLIRAGNHRLFLIHQTALRLHFAGRAQEAYDFMQEMGGFLHWNSEDHYGMACYASQIGSWKEAAEELLAGLREDFSNMNRMFSDLDFEPLYRHAAEGAMDMDTAWIFASPRFTTAFRIFAGREVEFDGILLRKMPGEFRRFLKCDLVQGFYSISPQAPEAVQIAFRGWFQSELDQLASLARRGIERAREMILGAQLKFATAAAKRGDFFAARAHTIFTLARKPERFAEFDAALSPLGMGYFFNDIRAAMKEDPNFRKLIAFITPSKKENAQQMMEILDDCGSAGKATVFWMLLRGSAAGDLESRAVARDWYIDVIRRWPDDPAAFLNALIFYENTKQWDTAGLLLANVPPAFYHFNAAEIHARRVERRESESSRADPDYAPFYGQQDIGGIVKNEPLPQTSFSEKYMKKPTVESRSQEYKIP